MLISMRPLLISRLWTWIALLLPLPIVLWSTYIALSVAQLQREMGDHVAFVDRADRLQRAVERLVDGVAGQIETGQSDPAVLNELLAGYDASKAGFQPDLVAHLSFTVNTAVLDRVVRDIVELAGQLPPEAGADQRLVTAGRIRREAAATGAIISGWVRAARDRTAAIRKELGMRWGSLNMLVLVTSVMALLVVVLMHSYRLSVVAQRRAEFERDRFFSVGLDLQFIADFRGRFKQVNRAWERTLGFSTQRVLAMQLDQLVHADDRRATWAQLERLRVGGDMVSFETRCRTASGAYRWMLWTATPDIERKLIYGTARDITERKHAQLALRDFADQLARSNQDLEEFASVASHDLQEPLRKVMTFTERLAVHAGPQLDPKSRDYLSRIRNVTMRMKSLIAGLLTLSRVTSRAHPFERVALNDVVREALGDLEVRIEQSRARIDVGPLPAIEADAMQMGQLFQNLIGNALKFHRPQQHPIVRVTSQPDPQRPDRVCIVVEDEGIGFDPQYAEQVFAPFHRLHGNDRYEGTGVGLAVCRKIVERHRGQIRAEGRPGQGARFVVTLPKHAPAVAAEEHMPPTDKPHDAPAPDSSARTGRTGTL